MENANTQNDSEQIFATNTTTQLVCQLSTAEILERKETVLKSLKSKILDRKELNNGYAFKFDGSDKTVDELLEFIKTERSCCNFFIYSLSISGDKTESWLQLTGPEGAKDFINEEMGL